MYSFDLGHVMRFIYDGIKYGDALDMLLLRSLLIKMTGVMGVSCFRCWVMCGLYLVQPLLRECS